MLGSPLVQTGEPSADVTTFSRGKRCDLGNCRGNRPVPESRTRAAAPGNEALGFHTCSAPGVGINFSARGRLVVSVWRPHLSIYGRAGVSLFPGGGGGRGSIPDIKPWLVSLLLQIEG